MRPSLEKVFKEQKTKTQKYENIYHAHVGHGYLLKEIADYLNIHYTTARKAIARVTEGRKRYFNGLLPKAIFYDLHRAK